VILTGHIVQHVQLTGDSSHLEGPLGSGEIGDTARARVIFAITVAGLVGLAVAMAVPSAK